MIAVAYEITIKGEISTESRRSSPIPDSKAASSSGELSIPVE